MIPGSEPVLLDLEKLFLLSDPMENHNFSGQVWKNKIQKNQKQTFLFLNIFWAHNLLGVIFLNNYSYSSILRVLSSKNSFSRSSGTGSDPGFMEIPALEDPQRQTYTEKYMF